jgi:hypothetical protein
LQSDIPNDRVKSTDQSLHVLIWDFDPKLILDLIHQLGEIKIGIGIAGIVPRSHTPPTIAKLHNVDIPNPDGDVLGDTAVGVVSLIEGLVVELRACL